MSDDLQKSPERARREWEDKLLHGRTAIFLVLNGFAGQKPTIPIASAIAAANCLWMLASFQSWIVIRALVKAYVTKSPPDEAQTVVDESLGTRCIHHILRPTTIFALWIPTGTYAGWLTFIGVAGASCAVWVAVVAAMALPFLVFWCLRSTLRKP